MSIKKTELLIYTPKVTNRLSYIFNFILTEILGLNYVLTDDIKLFNNTQTPKFTYSPVNQYTEFLFLEAHSILFEREIKTIELDIFNYENQKAFFKCNHESFFEFDLFAAAFYLISRYEEYLPYKADKFGRYPAAESIAVKAGFIEEPIVNNWAVSLKNKLLDFFPGLIFEKKHYQFISTIDIDNAFAHLHKGFWRSFLSSTELILKNPQKFREKILVLLRKKQDPYDTYDLIESLAFSKKTKTIFFILTSDYGKYDKNVPKENKVFRKLIQHIASNFQIGMHPSYQSNKNYNILKREKQQLEKISGKSINLSRQHFLKLSLPATYENLIKLGINEDYSMGYSSIIGFRAGTCSPFNFFNLRTNRSEDLKILPFAVMDACFTGYLQCEPETALKKIKKIISSIKKVNGLFVSLWHNENLGSKTNKFWWKEVFEQMLDEAKDGY